MMVFIDIRKAYDKVNRTKLFEILYEAANESSDAPGAKHLINCLADLYNGHQLVIQKDGAEKKIKSAIGVL
jgi:hypothetical protein